MVQYRRLTRDERYQIQALFTSGSSLRFIALQLKRNVSTISREIGRNQEKRGYFASKGHERSQKYIHRKRFKTRKIRGRLEKYIREKILLDWSPEQIVGRMKFERMKGAVSYLSIYRYLDRDKEENGKLWSHLRIKKKGKHRNKGKKYMPRIPERVMIEKRPKAVEARKRLGDYERDTVLGKFNGSVLLTIVDRASRQAKIVWLPKKCCKLVHQATVLRLKKEPLKTITNDNGPEFSRHRQTAKKLSAPVFFANSYHSWERGSNENFNGLLRQYFPRREDIGHPTAKHVREIENRLNDRPRKCLGYRSPNEVQKRLDRRVLRW